MLTLNYVLKTSSSTPGRSRPTLVSLHLSYGGHDFGPGRDAKTTVNFVNSVGNSGRVQGNLATA